MNQLFDTKPSCKTLNEKIPISSQATEANSIIVDSHSVNSDGQIRNESSAAYHLNTSPCSSSSTSISSSSLYQAPAPQPSYSSPSRVPTAGSTSPVASKSSSVTGEDNTEVALADDSIFHALPSTSASETHCAYGRPSTSTAAAASASEHAEVANPDNVPTSTTHSTATSCASLSTSSPSTSAQASSHAVRPVRVNFSLDASTAYRLRRLAHHNPRLLRKLGISTVLIRGTNNGVAAESISIPERKSPSPPPKSLAVSRQRPQSLSSSKNALSAVQRMDRMNSRVDVRGAVAAANASMTLPAGPHTPSNLKPPGTPLPQGRPTPTPLMHSYAESQSASNAACTESPLLMNLLSSSTHANAQSAGHMAAQMPPGGGPQPMRYPMQVPSGTAHQMMASNAGNMHYMPQQMQSQNAAGPQHYMAQHHNVAAGRGPMQAQQQMTHPMMVTPAAQPLHSGATMAQMDQQRVQANAEPPPKKRKRPTKKQQKELEAAKAQQEAAIQQQRMQQQQSMMAQGHPSQMTHEMYMMQQQQHQQQQRVPPVNMHMPPHNPQMPSQYPPRMPYTTQYPPHHGYPQQSPPAMMAAAAYPTPSYAQAQQQMWQQNMQQQGQMSNAQAQQQAHAEYQYQQQMRNAAMTPNQNASGNAVQQQFTPESPEPKHRMPPPYSEHEQQMAAAYQQQQQQQRSQSNNQSFVQHQHNAGGFMSPQSQHNQSPGSFSSQQMHHIHQQQQQHQQQHHAAAAFEQIADLADNVDVDELVAAMGSGEAEEFDLDSIEPTTAALTDQPQQFGSMPSHHQQFAAHQYPPQQQQAHHRQQQQQMMPGYGSQGQSMVHPQMAPNGAYGSPTRTPQPQYQQQHAPFHHTQSQLSQLQQQHNMLQQQAMRTSTPVEKVKRDPEELEQEQQDQLLSLMEARSPHINDAPHSPSRASPAMQQKITNAIENVMERVRRGSKNGDDNNNPSGKGKGGGRGKQKGKKAQATAAAAAAAAASAQSTPLLVNQQQSTPSQGQSPITPQSVKMDPGFSGSSHAGTPQSTVQSPAPPLTNASIKTEVLTPNCVSSNSYAAHYAQHAMAANNGGNGVNDTSQEYAHYNGHMEHRKMSSGSDFCNGPLPNHHSVESELRFTSNSRQPQETSSPIQASALKTEIMTSAPDALSVQNQTTTGPTCAPPTRTPPGVGDDPRVQKAATSGRRNRRKADLSKEASPRSDAEDSFTNGPEQLLHSAPAVGEQAAAE